VSIVVARIAAEPVGPISAASEIRPRTVAADSSDTASLPAQDALPPVLAPVPTPVPVPAILPPSQAFAAALIAERLPQIYPDPSDVLLANDSWQPPASDLRLTDRRV
jgi:hypothetical protein